MFRNEDQQILCDEVQSLVHRAIWLLRFVQCSLSNKSAQVVRLVIRTGVCVLRISVETPDYLGTVLVVFLSNSRKILL